MKKIFSLFVVFLFLFSILSLGVHAESGSGSDDSNSETQEDSSDGLDDDSKEEASEGETEIEDDETETEYEDDLDDDSNVMPVATSTTTASGIVPNRPVECKVDLSLIKKSNEIMMKIREKEMKKEFKDVEELKADLQKVNQEIRTKSQECKLSNSGKGSFDGNKRMLPTGNAQGLAVAVGLNCKVNEDIRLALDDAWKAYRVAVESGDDASIESAKESIKKAEEAIKEERKECMGNIVPGQEGQQRMEDCKVPEELRIEMESLWKEAKEAKDSGSELTDEQKSSIAAVEDKIASYKAKCRALPVNKNVEAGKVSEYFKERLSQTMSESDNPEEQVKALKELRKEIDETIKNLIKEKKKLNFKDVEDVTDELTLSSEGIAVGDADAEDATEVEIETEVEGETVSVSAGRESVTISQDGLNVESEEVSITSEGIVVNGKTVKLPPKAVLNKNKYLEQNMDRVKEMKLEKEGEKLVYKAKYDVKKKVFGFIPATARQELKVDAETGEVVSDKKPWWSSISSEDSSVEVEDKESTETTDVSSEDTETGTA